MGADSSARGGEIKSLREIICVALCNNNSPYYQQLQPLQEKAVFLKLFFRLLCVFFSLLLSHLLTRVINICLMPVVQFLVTFLVSLSVC